MVSQGVLLYFSKEMLDEDQTIQRKIRPSISDSGDSNEDQVRSSGCCFHFVSSKWSLPKSHLGSVVAANL